VLVGGNVVRIDSKKLLVRRELAGSKGGPAIAEEGLFG
jgi:hypothetical protein